ncbi:MAG: ABC transporter substrate-binding protein [Evtepia sp.]
MLAMVMAGAMCLSLAACGTPEETKPADGDAAAKPATAAALKMGFIGPLSGDNALYGNGAANGAKIAVEEINAKGGMQIELNPQDDEGDNEKAVNAYNNLKDWGAQMIVGCVTSSPCVAVSTDAFNDRMFMLTPSASSPDATKGKDNIYQLCFSDPNQGKVSAKYIMDNKLAEKVAIIYDNSDPYSNGIYQTFTSAAKELGMNIVSETSFTKDTANDFSVQLAAAQKAGAELIFLPIYYTPASLIMAQAKTMQYTPKFFGCDGLDGLLTLEGFDTKLAEGVMLLTPFAADADDAATKSFVEKYKAAYKDTPSQFAADGYDCVYAVYNACQTAKIDPATIKADEMCEKMIATFSDPTFKVDGLTGAAMTWKTTGEVSKEPKAVVIQDGTYVAAK